MPGQTYPLSLPTLRLTIAGSDRTRFLMARTLRINKFLGEQIDTAVFTLTQPETYRENIASIKPSIGAEVVIERQTGSGSFSTIYGGFIQRVSEPRLAYAKVRWDVSCTDYTALLTRKMAKVLYENRTVSEMVLDLVSTYAPLIQTDLDSSGGGVQDCPTLVRSMSFNYRFINDCLSDLAQMVGWEWFVDESKRLWFYDPTVSDYLHGSTLTVTDASNNYQNLRIEPKLDQVRNRIYVQGGLGLSDPISELWVSNGADTQWPIQLHNRDILPVEPFITVDGSPRSWGVQGTESGIEDAVEWLVDLARGQVTKSKNTATPPDLAELMFHYRYKYPITVVVEDPESQLAVAQLSADYDTIVLTATDTATESIEPQAYWRLNDSGATAVDETGNHNGAYAGAVTQGQPGVVLGEPSATSVLFPGTGFITVAHHADLNIGGTNGRAWAVQFWVRGGIHLGTIGTRWLMVKGNNTGDTLDAGGWAVVTVGVNNSVMLVVPSMTDTTGHVNLVPIGMANTSVVRLLDSEWHLITWVYDGVTGAFRVYKDKDLQQALPAAIVMGTSGNTDALVIGARSDAGTIWQGYLDEVVVWACNSGTHVSLATADVNRIWEAAQEDGVRESLVSATDTQTADEARAVGNLELAQWADIVTEVSWSSYVPGWRVGFRVTVNVTASATGHTFADFAKIQSLTISALGAQRLQYDISCQSVRFGLINFWRQLTHQQDQIAGRGDRATLSLARLQDDTGQAILCGPQQSVQIVGTEQYVVNDNEQGGLTPYASVEYGVVVPDYA